MTTKQLGLMGELYAKYDFVKAGWDVCSPEGDYAPYDFIAIKDRKILKIQVKTAQTSRFEDKVSFDIRSTNYHCEKRYNETDCEYIYLFDIPREKGFLINIQEVKDTTSVTIRYTRPKNNQMSGVRMEEEYLASNVLKNL